MTIKQLTEQIKAKQSLLCVGLDTDITKIPPPFVPPAISQYGVSGGIFKG